MITSLVLLSLPALTAHAAAEPHCYTFTTVNLPYREAHVLPRMERWCYQDVPSPGGGTFLYNADHERVLPELALVSLPNGTLTHGSLQAGKVSLHSVRSAQFNPFPVPLREPNHLATATAPQDPRFRDSARAVLSLLLLGESPNPAAFHVQAGVTAAQAANPPWRGYWWPLKGQPMMGPLSKYDRYASSRGRNAGAALWESTRHVSHGLWWEGHCNGWAAASILRPEPRQTVTDTASGVAFTVSDQKGLLSEADYCANITMFGRRNNGGGDPADVRPEVFHKALTYYIGSLHKLVAMDYRKDAVVDNRVVSAYSMQITDSGPNEVTVVATLKVHGYDAKRTDAPGPAPFYYSVYRYTLQKGENGAIIGGRWLSDNPDFLWVPLSPGKCAGGNPNLDPIVSNSFGSEGASTAGALAVPERAHFVEDLARHQLLRRFAEPVLGHGFPVARLQEAAIHEHD